uniref:F-box domain-containing protein n=1 Tax=Lotus japonicus TaxID=34305 RepID=I3S5L9_LOTJA|nr:unknown [Lotus japonicus]
MKLGIEFLPWEIQVEILSWLPVKTLMQFKCVCKSWKSLISNDKLFKKNHLHKSARNNHCLFTLQVGEGCYHDEDEDHCLVPCPVRRLVEDPSSLIDEDGCCNLKGKYWLIDSCNGLVCFRYTWGYTWGYDYLQGRCRFRFWNPATRLWSKKSPTLIMDRMLFGFGYDDSSDTYKVVGIAISLRGHWETAVYCMGDSCLREISSKPSLGLSPMTHWHWTVCGWLS